MTRTFALPALILAGIAVASVPVQADGMSQLISAAGLTEAEAAQMSLTEIYAYKINRESGRDNKVTVSSRSVATFRPTDHPQLVRAAGLSVDEAQGMSLAEIAAYKANRGATRDAKIPAPRDVQAGFDPTTHPQLVARAGLDTAEAADLSLSEIFRRKNNGEVGRDGQQVAPR